jgi:isoleucyl-tRNA synthetase
VPFVTETLYQNLVRRVDSQAPLSVHHCAWPEMKLRAADAGLLADMAVARTVVNLGHATRASSNLKVRQPLGRAVVVVAPELRAALRRRLALVADELNVKQVELAAQEAELITYKLLPDNRLLGPRFGQLFPKVREALNKTEASAAVATLRSGKNLALMVDGQAVALAPNEVLINLQPRPGFAVAAEGGVVVALDTAVTPELRAEGLAREFVRRVQDLRKAAGFDISDRVATHFTASSDLAAAISQFASYIKSETLTLELVADAPPAGAATSDDEFDGEQLSLGLVKATLTARPGVKSKAGAKRKVAKTKKFAPARKNAAAPKRKPPAIAKARSQKPARK